MAPRAGRPPRAAFASVRRRMDVTARRAMPPAEGRPGRRRAPLPPSAPAGPPGPRRRGAERPPRHEELEDVGPPDVRALRDRHADDPVRGQSTSFSLQPAHRHLSRPRQPVGPGDQFTGRRPVADSGRGGLLRHLVDARTRRDPERVVAGRPRSTTSAPLSVVRKGPGGPPRPCRPGDRSTAVPTATTGRGAAACLRGRRTRSARRSRPPPRCRRPSPRAAAGRPAASRSACRSGAGPRSRRPQT